MLQRVVFAHGWWRGDEIDDAADDIRRQCGDGMVVFCLVERDATECELRFGHDEENGRLVRRELWHFHPDRGNVVVVVSHCLMFVRSLYNVCSMLVGLTSVGN